MSGFSKKYVLAIPYGQNSYGGVAEYRYINPSEKHYYSTYAVDFYETHSEAWAAYCAFKTEYNNRHSNKVRRLTLPSCRILQHCVTLRK